MQQHDDEEVRQLMAALPDTDSSADPRDYIVSLPDEQVHDLHAPTFFTAGMTDPDDPTNPDAEQAESGNGDTELIDSMSSDASDAIGTEEVNVSMPVDAALLALQNARRFFEENTRPFDVKFVTQLSRMMNAIFDQQAGIAMAPRATTQPGIRAFFHRVGSA